MDSPRTPLDVELLAEAIRNVVNAGHWIDLGDSMDFDRVPGDAAAIAAEYLRLQSTDPSPGEPSESAPFPHPDEE